MHRAIASPMLRLFGIRVSEVDETLVRVSVRSERQRDAIVAKVHNGAWLKGTDIRRFEENGVTVMATARGRVEIRVERGRP